MKPILLNPKFAINLNNQIQQGYNLVFTEKIIDACNVWFDLWKEIASMVKKYNFEYIEDLEISLNESECIYSWAKDFELELYNASLYDISFANIRIQFCKQFINLYKDKSDTIIFSMKKAIGESYFIQCNIQKGDEIFNLYLSETPEWTNGWIGWAEQYMIYDNNRDYLKAVDILQKALKFEELEDRLEVIERLDELYTKLDSQN